MEFLERYADQMVLHIEGIILDKVFIILRNYASESVVLFDNCVAEIGQFLVEMGTISGQFLVDDHPSAHNG